MSGEDIRLRQATPGDHAALGDVCLRTGADGGDASAIEDDPTLVGQIFAVPYQVFAPDHAYVLEDAQGVCGYVLGAPDTAAMDRWLREVWFPPLAARLPRPDPDPARWQGSDWARWHIHTAPPLPAPCPARYPAHGHIDLLPRARGLGWGRRGMDVLMAGLAATGAPGLSLDVSPRNANALSFYAALGFVPAPMSATDQVILVRDLP